MAIADLQRFQEVLGKTKAALILLPENPNLDAVASALALNLALQKRGISTSVACPTPMTVEFNRLVGVNRVKEDLGNKNLVISFENYPAEDIEKVSYNVENSRFALTVVPKSGKNPPSQQQINLSYGGVAADLVVVVGANYPDGLGKFAQNKEILDGTNLCLLSNAPLSGWQRAIELIDPSQGSISEVAHDLIEKTGLSLDADIATNLYLGISAGTSNFTAQNIGPQTFEKAAKLLREGAQRPQGGAVQQVPAQQQEQKGAAPQDWLQPKVYKGSTLP